MSEEAEEKVEQAVRRLLRATQDFTRAYEAWVEAPRSAEHDRRLQLELAEDRMTQAKREVVFAQTRKG